jgi:hypothetical protein
MSAVATAVEKILSKFRAAKILTIVQLTALLSCSVRTARRRLKECGAISSYNRNGRFYTVPEVAQFDSNGLWRWRGVCFSRHGSLTETVAALIRDSEAGLTVSELGAVLGVNAYSFICGFTSHPEVAREKLAGRYVYFCSDRATRQQQSRRRRQADRARAGLPSDAVAVVVLAEMIRHPHVSVEQISRRLARQGTDVSPAKIRRLLEQHGLADKKGALDSASSLPCATR